MATEIERKFLVVEENWRANADHGVSMRQGYFENVSQCSIRVRTADEHAWLTIKSANSGITRSEFEYAIPNDDAEALLDGFCTRPLIAKTRYRVPYAEHVWEIDVFDGANAGLTLAEIELGRPDERFERPSWLGCEVTDEARFYNAALARHPFTHWTDEDTG